MIINQKDVKIGDTLLMAKSSKLAVIKIIGITKSGSLKYSYSDTMSVESVEDPYIYTDKKFLELDVSKHNKQAYIQKGFVYEKSKYNCATFFWLLDRV